MLDQNVVLDENNVRSNPVHGRAEMRKSPVHDDEVSISDDRSWLILESRGKALHEIEQTLKARCDMSAVLNVVKGPIAPGRYAVTCVEQRVERFQNKLFIFLLSRTSASMKRSGIHSSLRSIAPVTALADFVPATSIS